jgi:TRAP-type C4-dicarboxylate transport system permease small subunit
MELALVGMIFLSMPGVFLRDENVTVDVIDQFVSRKVRAALRMFGLLMALGFLLVVFIPMVPQAMDKYRSVEVTMTLGIHRFNHWIPILIGFGGAILATLWVLGHYALYGTPRDPSLDNKQLH